MSKLKKDNKKSKKINSTTIILTLALLLLVGFTVVNKLNNSNDKEKTSSSNKQGKTVLNDNGDLVITKSDISSKATFYPVEVDGTKLEVIAVEAPDGTIRTAFNTCQVCFSSGRGYYVQQNDLLICQNCGNRFKTSDVEVSRGGCNPVPIFDEEKTVNDDTIVISNDYLKEAKQIFANWKKGF
ncbi:DUF2318 domain-containing protein [Lachnoclostridium phytofermentans]|nr:DUF2318 domain-containing protein [Lachnoclostridium phytofermentans]